MTHKVESPRHPTMAWTGTVMVRMDDGDENNFRHVNNGDLDNDDDDGGAACTTTTRLMANNGRLIKHFTDR